MKIENNSSSHIVFLVLQQGLEKRPCRICHENWSLAGDKCLALLSNNRVFLLGGRKVTGTAAAAAQMMLLLQLACRFDVVVARKLPECSKGDGASNPQGSS